MARLADDRSVVQAAEQAEETAGAAGLECERGRQLHQQRSERGAKSGDLAEEPGQRLARTGERALVRDQLGILTEKRNEGGTAAAQRW